MLRIGDYEKEVIDFKTVVVIFSLSLLLLFGLYSVFYDPYHYYQRPIGLINQTLRGIQNLVILVINVIIDMIIDITNLFVDVKGRVETFFIDMKNWIRFIFNSFHHLWRSIKEFFSIKKYFLVSTNRILLDGFEFMKCPDCMIIAQFEEKDQVLRIIYEIPHKKSKLSILFHKAIERIFDISVDYGWVGMDSKIPNADWSRYNSANFFVKSDGEPIKLEFSIWEFDGDAWYFFDEKVSNMKDWVSVSMPFEDFVHPSWAPLGDGKKEFKNVTMFQITITSFDRAVNNTLYFKLKGDSLIYLE